MPCSTAYSLLRRQRDQHRRRRLLRPHRFPGGGCHPLRQAYDCWKAGADPIEWAKTTRNSRARSNPSRAMPTSSIQAGATSSVSGQHNSGCLWNRNGPLGARFFIAGKPYLIHRTRFKRAGILCTCLRAIKPSHPGSRFTQIMACVMAVASGLWLQ